jgi:hypothetical protein
MTNKDEEMARRVRENRLRRAAQRQGLTLLKCRARDPRAIGFGLFMICKDGTVERGRRSDYSLTIDQVERRLKGEDI